jgi:hypothetical protein
MATITADQPRDDATDASVTALAFGPLAIAGMASLGAGAIHAAAIGVHSEHAQAARTFAVIALVQLGWGAIGLVSRRRSLAVLGALVNLGAVAGWALATTRGISFIDGLGEVERVQWPDFLAAALALASVLVVLRSLVAGRSHLAAAPRALAVNGVGIAVLALSMVGMTTAGNHSHAHGEEAAAGGHVHGTETGTSETTPGTGTHQHTAIAPTEYDPTKPIDLSGVPGVTPEQQARAENMIAITLIRLPQFADYKVAEARGYHSIGDGFTGHEHFIKWDTIDDDHILDPDHPESLVYEPQKDGSKKLVSAMFMLPQGSTLEDVPDLGGALTQWHIHNNLCFTTDPKAPRVAGITTADGGCPKGLQKFKPVPMIHVWITKHPCGPFAALEGVGAGQVKPGDTKLCDHVHGSGF